MPEDKFDTERVRDYWLIEAEEALRVDDHLVASKDYSYALFFGHLAVEKMLNALFAVTYDQHPLYGHNAGHQPSSHGWDALQHPTMAVAAHREFEPQAVLIIAEIVKIADCEHVRQQSFALPHQVTRAPSQPAQALPEGGVQPFDVGGIDHR